MAFDVNAYVASRTKAAANAGGFNVDEYLKSRGITKKPDLTSVEGLSQYAREQGYEKDVSKINEETPKLSALQRLGKGLGFLNPAEAILTGTEKGALKGIGTYVTGAAKDVASAITGTDYNPDKRSFSDVAEKFGIENSIAKFGLGFAGDVLLDPSTYFGGAIAKGLIGGAKGATNIALKGVEKVAPEVAGGIKMTTEALQDAIGRAFNYKYKAQEGAAEDVLTFLGKREKARLGLAESNLNRLGTGVLTDEQRAELALKLVAGKRAEFAAKEAGKTAEEVTTAVKEATKTEVPGVTKLIEEQTGRTTKFGENLGLENPYESYFPFIKTDKLKTFLDESSSKGIRVGSEGYRKEFKNLLTNEAIELDPAKAFFTSEAAKVSDKMTRDFLSGFVEKYGKPLSEFATSDDAAAAGYRLLHEKGSLGKVIGYVPQYDARLITNLISPEFQTINMLAKATGFDAITNLFKRSVTGLFLPFHVRNFTSGIIQNFETLGVDALNPKLIASGMKFAQLLGKGAAPAEGVIDVLGRPTNVRKVFKAFEDRFGTSNFYQNDFADALKAGEGLKSAEKILSKSAAKETIKTLGLGQNAIPFKTGRAIGQFIEHSQKATAYLGALAQGKTIKEALSLAERAGFDYRALTRFESQILRRVIPFYSFTRKNIELQLKTLGENPQRINQIMAFFQNRAAGLIPGEQPTEEEKKSLPDYIKDSFGIKLADTPEGLKQYISSFGTPVEAFASLFNKNPILFALSQTNPLIKAPIEIGIGKDSFRQRDLKDVYDAREYKMAPQIIKDLLDIKEVEKPVLKKNPVTGKLEEVGKRTQYIADPVKLLIARSLFTSRGVSYLDQAFGGDIKGLAKALKLSTGLKPQQIDIEAQAAIKERDKRRELEDLLTKTGKAASFSRLFIPKTSTALPKRMP